MENPNGQHITCPSTGAGSEGEGWERDRQAGGPSLGWLHCDTGMLLTHSMVFPRPPDFCVASWGPGWALLCAAPPPQSPHPLHAGL